MLLTVNFDPLESQQCCTYEMVNIESLCHISGKSHMYFLETIMSVSNQETNKLA